MQREAMIIKFVQKGTYYEKTAYKKYGQPNKSPWVIEIDNLSDRVR